MIRSISQYCVIVIEGRDSWLLEIYWLGRFLGSSGTKLSNVILIMDLSGESKIVLITWNLMIFWTEKEKCTVFALKFAVSRDFLINLQWLVRTFLRLLICSAWWTLRKFTMTGADFLWTFLDKKLSDEGGGPHRVRARSAPVTVSV